VSPCLTGAQGAAIVALARASLEAAVRGLVPPTPPAADFLARRAGAFVSLHAAGQLRGCIGQPEPHDPLGSVVVHCAAAAAREDPRFPPVAPGELPRLVVEVSVLTPPRDADPAAIEVGRHGLIVSQGRRRGLLLPQVAVEWGWDREAFLAHTCRKAGLAPDAWRQGAQIQAFEAEIFSEPPSDA
jgi:AmmeMemoRadiSam system protein A